MRGWPSILHLDLDAFFAAVEQRDKPSLRGKPVAVGGAGARGVVATASYEARVFGLHSAMSGAQARRRCPGAAFLSGRFDAYQQSSAIVRALMGRLSPLVEPLSLDEAYIDLEAGGHSASDVEHIVATLRADVEYFTEGLTASVGVGTSKFMAKVASELGKPNGFHVVEAGGEIAAIEGLPVRAVPGVGPVAQERLAKLGITLVRDLQAATKAELIRELGTSWGNLLHQLAFAIDERDVVAETERKSVSMEDTFEVDIVDRDALHRVIEAHSAKLSKRLARAGLFARTISIKVRHHDFQTLTRSRTLPGATSEAERISSVARELLAGVDCSAGLRLLGVGTSGLVPWAQEMLFETEPTRVEVEQLSVATSGVRRHEVFATGAEIETPAGERGWVWGTGRGIASVRFETRYTGVGPVRNVPIDALRPAQLLPLRGDEMTSWADRG